MNLSFDISTISQEAGVKPKTFESSLEYDLIASLAYQQYTKKNIPNFEALLSIPLKERIPGLITEYGLTRMHQLVMLVLQQFLSVAPIAKTKSMTEACVSACSFDLLLAADEDQLGLEDLIVFFESIRREKFKAFKARVTQATIMLELENYREHRYQAYDTFKREKQAALKISVNPSDRMSPNPTPIKNLFEKAGGKIVPFKPK